MEYRCIHHTGDKSPLPQLKKVTAYHNAGAGGKWKKGYGIQYHVFIEKSGEIHFCHTYAKVIWHSGSDKWNKQSNGWCLAGDFTRELPTEAQLSSLFRMWRDEGYPPLVTHKQVRPKPTDCPGKFDFIAELNKRRSVASSPTPAQKILALTKRLSRAADTKTRDILNGVIKRLKSRT